MKLLVTNTWLFTVLTTICFIILLINPLQFLNQDWQDITLAMVTLTTICWTYILIPKIKIVNARTWYLAVFGFIAFICLVFFTGCISSIWLQRIDIQTSMWTILYFGSLWVIAIRMMTKKNSEFINHRYTKTDH